MSNFVGAYQWLGDRQQLFGWWDLMQKYVPTKTLVLSTSLETAQLYFLATGAKVRITPGDWITVFDNRVSVDRGYKMHEFIEGKRNEV